MIKPKRLSVIREDLFWPKAIVLGPDDCWVWTAGTLGKGYGQFSIGKVKHGAHRVAWRIANGDIPTGLCVLHTCDNPPCVNPRHLWLGTNQDNVDDRESKGRNQPSVGENSHWAKLTENDVRTIRKLHQSGLSKWAISRRYPVSWSAIDSIVSRQTWKHLLDDAVDDLV